MTAKEAKAPAKEAKTTKQKISVKTSAKTAKSSAKTTATKPEPAKSEKSDSNVLRTWNIRLALLLAAEAVAVVVASGSRTVELTTQYLAKDILASEAAGQTVFAAATRHLADVRLAWVIAAFLLLFAVGYFLAGTVWRKKYESWLERGVNNLRWVIFGVGGGAALAAVAMPSGVSDVYALGLIFGSTVLAGLLASSVELLGSGRSLRRLLAGGAILGVVLPWLLFASTVAGSVVYGGQIPAYLYYVYASVTLLLVAVGAALYFRVKRRGKWVDTIYTEKMFMGLGVVTATILALQIFAGALQP